MFESTELSTSGESAALLDQACTAARTEAQATARRLNVIADLMRLRDRQYGDRAEWVADLWDAIAAELAAALRVSRALASSYMRDAEVMRERLPKVGDCLAAGAINYAMVQVIAYRTALITDEKALAAVDAQVAIRAPRWPSLTRGRLAMRVDAIVAQVDRDAIRRTNKEVKDRYLNVSESVPGIAEVYGNVFASTGRALDRNVVIYVVAEQASVEGRGATPGFMAGADGLIPPEVVAELAKSATLQPLIVPAAATNPHRTPAGSLPSAPSTWPARPRSGPLPRSWVPSPHAGRVGSQLPSREELVT